jgi:cell division septum initiation protein DivIVA
MAEKKDFLNWVGFREESERTPVGNPADRIRELESQLSDLRSRRDITSLSKEEFEILATETAMVMIKSAQSREAKAFASAERLINESTRNAKDVLEGAESKARSILSGAEARGRKYISAAETEAQDVISEANREAESLIDSKRREAVALASAARREGERIVADAANEVIEYRRWLAEVISESERLYRVQSQALVAAEQAIAQSRQRLDGAFARLANMQAVVNDSLNEDGTVRHKEPVRVESRRSAPALDAPARGTSVKSEGKNRPARKSAVKKTASKRK